jgi:hypothetical protein
MVTAEAAVEVLQHGHKLRPLCLGRQVLLQEPITVDPRTAADNNRRTRDSSLAPTLVSLVGADSVDVTPDATDRLDAVIVGVAAIPISAAIEN